MKNWWTFCICPKPGLLAADWYLPKHCQYRLHIGSVLASAKTLPNNSFAFLELPKHCQLFSRHLASTKTLPNQTVSAVFWHLPKHCLQLICIFGTAKNTAKTSAEMLLKSCQYAANITFLLILWFYSLFSRLLADAKTMPKQCQNLSAKTLLNIY